MAEVATAKNNTDMVSGTAIKLAKEVEVMNAQKVLLDVQTGLSCVQMADKQSSVLANAGLKIKLPKVCDKYLENAKKEEPAK